MADSYKKGLFHRYREYQKSHFPDGQSFFDCPYAQDKRPPVFIPSEAWRNIILDPAANPQEIDQLLSLVPAGEKHKWYRSMNSSQAMAQSILGNLATHSALHYLSDIKADEGENLFGDANITSNNFEMEYKVGYLGEPRPTSLDGYISGKYRIAIECKFTEADVGTCSRPRLTPTDSNYENEHCVGTYTIQRSRKERCSLTEIGILYWHYVPVLFKWENDRDLRPCPLLRNYQLIRNILAVGVKSDGTVSNNNGHALLIYDQRNPAFQIGGKGLIAFLETQKALQEPTMLRRCSWQRIIQHLRDHNIMSWLIQDLALKYGL